jgi:leucyl-tRNA synthetase
MDIVPEEIRQEFNYVIDWLRERACARKSGLGTKLPLDQDWIIESLSDSVIYMSYYILAKYVNSNNNNNSTSHDDSSNKLIININNVDALNNSFFDYILLGNGDVRQVAAECNISVSLMELIRKEFSYFYPLDARHSGRDLVQNHLSFFIFNHVAIFTRENWPRKIVVNGSVLMEGKKMSKSLGNIIPLRAAIKEHSADAIRLAMLSSAELLQDADFSFDAIKGIRSKLDDIYDMAIEHSMVKSKFRSSSTSSSIILSEAKREIEDRWLVSRLQNHITDITASMDKLRVRKALHDILYLLDQDLQWYKKRIMGKNRDDSLVAVTLSVFLDNRIRMLAPFAPFISEELWEIIGGNSNSIIFAGWPIVDEDKRDPVAEESEQLIINLISDLQNILKVTKISPTKIIIFTSARWKQQIYQKILEYILLENKTNFGDIMKQLIKDAETSKAKKDPKLIRNMIEDILSDPIEARNRRLKLTFFNEIFPLNDAKKLLSLESGNAQAEIIVHSEDEIQKYDPREKSKYSRPFKPAIYIE